MGKVANTGKLDQYKKKKKKKKKKLANEKD